MQQTMINKTIGCCRFVYNHFLSKRKEMYELEKKILSYNKCSSNLTMMKKELIWLKEVDSTALQGSLKSLDDSYRRFFKKQNQFPKFKSKRKSAQTYTSEMTNGNIKVTDTHIQLPKLGLVRYAKSRDVQGRILRATVRKSPTGKYFVSIMCDIEIEKLPNGINEIGIDLGLKSFATTSDGEIIENPKYLMKYMKKLSYWQRKHSRRVNGGKNKEKARLKLAIIYEKVKNSRLDFLHNLTSKLINDNQVIAIEDLDVQKMLQKSKMSRGISDVGWGEFRRQLEYKSNWYGREIRFVNRFFASSQICSSCGYKNNDLINLKIREWICTACGSRHDRDLNAANNILKSAI